MVAIMADLASDRSADPEAQAAVTDFLDYTEYLPSDILRSLTLIRGLDDKYLSSSYTIHDLTKQYGSIPSLEPSMRPDVANLRLQISSNLDQALNARESAYAEACRLFDVADRHQNRLKSIIARLKAIPKPPSRPTTPDPTPSSAQKRSRAGREIKNGMSSARLTLNPPRGNTIASAILHRPRGRRITVPGEVMPPYDPDEAIASTEVSDWESPPPSPPRPALKLKQLKIPKEKLENGEERPRAPRQHVQYRKPTPPPEDAEIGSKHRPWTHLTEYEMYKLRKKMKKNHEWEPSTVMIRRELESRGRGWDNYYKAKADAEKHGTAFHDIESSSQPKIDAKIESVRPSQTPITPAATSTPDPLKLKSTAPKRTDPRKDRRKADPVRDRAALAAQEAELAARRLGDIGSAFKNLFSPVSSVLASLQRSTSTPTANASVAGKKTAKKRKLEELDVSASPSAEPEAKKKQKLAPTSALALKPSSVPSLATNSEPPQESAGKIKIPLKLNVPATAPASESESSSAVSSAISSAASSEDSSSAPATSTRAASAARSSIALKTEEATPPPPARSASRASRASRKSTVPPDLSTHEATPAPATAPAVRASARTTPAAAVRQTPTVDTSPKIALPTAASRRPRREIPGTVMQSSQDGGAAISVSVRKSKPVHHNQQQQQQQHAKTPANKALRNSTGSAANSTPEIRTDKDGNREWIDPDEERYCVCGDVSWGDMIECKLSSKCNDGQWFHMECVGLVEMPGRTIQWYCPHDRKKEHMGEHTNGLVGRGYTS